MPPQPTWDDVRESHNRAVQLESQALEAYARTGDMLLELKETTPRGEFTQKCREALYEPDMACQGSDEAAWQKASRYMRVASHREQWLPHNPQSLSEALRIIAPARVPEEEPEPAPEEPQDDTRTVHIHVHHLTEEELRQEQARKREENERLHEGRQKQWEEAQARAEREKARDRKQQQSWSSFFSSPFGNDSFPLTKEEYRLVLNCLHPDRAPEDRKERFTQAFAIMQSLEKYFK